MTQLTLLFEETCGDCDSWTNLAMDISVKKGKEERRIHYRGCSTRMGGGRVDHGHCSQHDECRLEDVDACEHFQFLPNKDSVRRERLIAKWQGKMQTKHGKMITREEWLLCQKQNGKKPSKT